MKELNVHFKATPPESVINLSMYPSYSFLQVRRDHNIGFRRRVGFIVENKTKETFGYSNIIEWSNEKTWTCKNVSWLNEEKYILLEVTLEEIDFLLPFKKNIPFSTFKSFTWSNWSALLLFELFAWGIHLKGLISVCRRFFLLVMITVNSLQ